MPIQICEWRARIGCFFQRRRKKTWLERQSRMFEQSLDFVEKLFGLLKLKRKYDEYYQRNERVSTERGKRSTNNQGMSKNGEPYSQNDLNENACTPYAGSLNTASKDKGSNDSCVKDESVQGKANQDLTEEDTSQSYSSVEYAGSGRTSGADGTQLSLTSEGVQSSNNKSPSTNPRTQASYNACKSTSEPCTKSDTQVERTLSEHLSRKVNGSGPGFDLKKTVKSPESSLEHPPNAASPAKCTTGRCNDHTSNVDNDIACIGELLLLQAGDVETNPGPNEKPQNLKSLEVCKLAELMDPRDYRKVGLALGITEAALRRYEHDKETLEWATYHMLNEWLKTVKEEEARTILVDKLRSIPLENLANRLAAGLDMTAFSSLSDEDVQRCSEDLKQYYSTRFCQIQADPLYFDTLLQFDDIFTNLELVEEEKSTKCKAPLDYDKLLETKVNGVYPKRLLVEGEGGAGKTTLCARLAWDWLKGRCFQQFKLVLVVLLRYAKDQTVGKVIKTYLSDSNPVEAWQIDKYILTNHKDVFLVCDGLDEYGGDFESSQDIPQIIHNHAYKSTTVLVTSRPWRADEVRGRRELRQAYAFIAVQGFTPDNLASYITKFFVKDPDSGFDLNQFMLDNDVIAENMSPFPIYTAMLCIMWKEYNQERRQAMYRLQTFSQLFREIVYFLIDHYISKISGQSYEDASEVGSRRDIALGILKKIGEMALNGLFKKRLDLSESDFESCPEAMEAGCRIGVLSRERCFAQRKDTYNTSSPVMSTFHFPHKLFQEYLAAMQLAALYRTNRSRYDQLMSQTVIPQCREFRYLVYFTSAQEKDVGVDIISHLPTKDERAYGQRQSNTDFLVDVAFECHSQVAVEAVQHALGDRTDTLTIDKEMTPHTVAGYLYVMERLHLETLSIARRCGRTVSRDAAEFISTSSSLRSLELKIEAEMHDEFYKVLADHAEQAGSSQIESLDLRDMNLQVNASASRDLGLFVCGALSLTEVRLDYSSFHDGFFSALASKASGTQIESLYLDGMELHEYASASRDLGLFVCGAPSLTEVHLYNCSFHDGFFSALASKASGTQIESLDLSYMNLQMNASASRNLGLSVCGVPSLTMVRLFHCSFHDGFFSALALKASGTQAAGWDSIPPCPLSRLWVDEVTLSGWTYGDMRAVFPSLKRVALVVRYVSDDIDLPVQLQLPGVTVLNVIPEQGSADITRREAAYLEKLPTVFPHLLKLTFTDFMWSSDDARSLLRSLSSHPHLRVLRIMRCGLDALLDSVAEEVNRAGRVRVTVDHSKPKKLLYSDREDEESDDEDISHYDHTAGLPGSTHASQDDPTAGLPGSTHVSQDDPTAGVSGSTHVSQDDPTAGGPGSTHVSQDDPTAGLPGSIHVSQDDPTTEVPGSTHVSRERPTAGLPKTFIMLTLMVMLLSMIFYQIVYS